MSRHIGCMRCPTQARGAADLTWDASVQMREAEYHHASSLPALRLSQAPSRLSARSARQSCPRLNAPCCYEHKVTGNGQCASFSTEPRLSRMHVRRSNGGGVSHTLLKPAGIVTASARTTTARLEAFAGTPPLQGRVAVSMSPAAYTVGPSGWNNSSLMQR